MKRSLSKAYGDYQKKMKNLNQKDKERLELVEKMALELMYKHNVSDYKFKFGYGWTYKGKCTSKTIIIQYNFALRNNLSEIKNTILHEIAHAIVGVDEWHRFKWQLKAKELGVTYKRNYRK